MTRNGKEPATLAVNLLIAASLVVVLVSAGCSSGSDRPLEIVYLSQDRAAELADSIRQSVGVELADGLELSLWAPEQLVADPIALAIDDQGRAWITRTIRQKNSEFDIRGFVDWEIPSIGWTTVEDRRAFLHETFSPEKSDENDWLADLNADSSHDWRDLTVQKERAYRVEDTSGDGRADKAQLYIDDFHDEVTDIAGALLPVGEDVYLGVAPDIWRLKDTSGDGMADEQKSISHGYGVHIGFSGHNISGMIMGPDGRLYWSIGDIGSHVVSPDGEIWAYSNQGAIFRSELDGSGFEVFAAGVRNTHEFVFDKYGNLISVDNDGDHNEAGEQERVVYLVNGSDSGWRSNWQYGKYHDPDNNGYNVWIDEGLFKPRFEGQAAYILPPVASYHAGPAGMAYNPGTALNDAWQDRFFVSEFTGSAARSHIYAFQLKPQGAGFTFAGEEVVTRGILTTGIDFGPDGALYVADWIAGWGTNDQGRIWKIDVPGADTSADRLETKSLLAEDLAMRDDGDLLELLQHADMRVRMKAQFELVARKSDATLLAAIQQDDHQLARLHGIWGLGQRARTTPDAAEPLATFLTDGDPEVRAQAAKMLGDVRYARAADALLPLLQDAAPRARFFATEALGRMSYRPALEPILSMLEANNDEDAYLRHGGAIALARIGDAEALVDLADHESRALRTVAVIALRRLRDPGVARFLQDADPYVATEAARAINDDESIESALPALAGALTTRLDANEAFLRRALNANLRLGGQTNAEVIASFSTRKGVPPALRAEAIAILGTWSKPSLVDRVDGVYRGAVALDASAARTVLNPIVEILLADADPSIKVATVEAAGRLQLDSAFPTLLKLLRTERSVDVRMASLRALNAANYEGMGEAVQVALRDGDEQVRMIALGFVDALSLPAEQVAGLLSSVMDQGTVVEQQAALAMLGRTEGESAQAVLSDVFGHLEEGTLNPALQLDVMEAVDSGGSSELVARLKEYRTSRSSSISDPMTRSEVLKVYGETLYGGNVILGRRVFRQQPAAQCLRCHAFGNQIANVGPDLTGIGGRLSREELLEALVSPSTTISPGYGSVTLALKDGTTTQGILKEETDVQLAVMTADGSTQVVQKEEIVDRTSAPSAMPPMGQILSRREIRDIISFLVTQDGT